MRGLRAWCLRSAGLFHKERRDRELAEELESHLQMHIEDNLRSGMNPAEARRQAVIKLGGIEQAKENYRDRRGIPVLETVLVDLRFALRVLRGSPGFTAVAVLTLALGIGASTVVFSVVYNIFFDALPYKNFDRSVVFEVHNLANNKGWRTTNSFSAAEIRAFREQNHVFEDSIVHANLVRLFYDDGESIRMLKGEAVTTNTFDYLGVPPLVGRAISQEDGSPDAPPVFVMNYRLWRQEFAGDPKILGTIFILSGKPTALVGIMPWQFNAFNASVWLPMRSDQAQGSLMGRLKPAVSVQSAGAELNAIAHRVHETNPGQALRDKFEVVPESLLDSLTTGFKKTIYVLLAAVLLLLLIACGNVANLLLARATAREREIAMRATLGATRGRLIRQMVVECAVLAVAASASGYAFAYFGLKIVIALIPAGALPEEALIRLNAPVLFLSLGVTILTTILCCLAPALHVVRGDLQPRLTGSGMGIGGSFRHGKLRAGLVVSEVALSIILLIGAGLLMRSFLVLTRTDLGFDPKNVLYFQLVLPNTYNTNVAHSRERKNALTHQLLDRMQALPGVTSVAESIQHPPDRYEWSDTIIPGKPHTELWETRLESCSEGYFQTLGLPLLRGRLFSEYDVNAARDVMVVNEAFSRQYFPNEDPLGHKVKFEVLDRPYLDAPHDTYFEIVGIVRDSKTRDYDNPSWQLFPQAFYPYSVQGYNFREFMARTAVDPNSLLKDIGREVRHLDPSVGIGTSGTLEASLQEFYRGPQFELVTVATFAVMGLLLVAIGIFSVMAYTVSLQTREIGIRMALGANQGDILRMVIGKGFRLIAAGIVIGLVASLVLTRLLASQIWGVSPTDPSTFASVVAVIIAVGVAACLFPARRATRVDPMVALRHE